MRVYVMDGEEKGVWEEVKKEPHMKPISTRWVDTNKGDDVHQKLSKSPGGEGLQRK